MNNTVKRQMRRTARRTSLYIVLTGILFIIVFPIFFLFSFSFMSDYETYSEWPKPLIPSVKAGFMLEQDVDGYHLSIFNKSEDQYMPFGPLAFQNTEKDLGSLKEFVKRQANCTIKIPEFRKYLDNVKPGSPVYFTINKNLLANYVLFFQVVNGAPQAVLNSLMVAFATIAISLTIGGWRDTPLPGIFQGEEHSETECSFCQNVSRRFHSNPDGNNPRQNGTV